MSNKCSSAIYVAVGGKGGALTTIGGAAQPAGWKQAPGDYIIVSMFLMDVGASILMS